MVLTWIKTDVLITQAKQKHLRDLDVPKNALNIANFSGGLNNNTNTRDVNPEELIVLDGVDIETPGKVRLIGHVDDAGNINDNVSLSGSNEFNYGNGLFCLNLDRKIDSSTNTDNTEYLFINDASAKKVRMWNKTDETIIAGNDNRNISYGTTAASVEYLMIDGDLRVSSYVNLDGSSGVPFPTTNKVKVLSYLDTRKRLGVSDTGVSNAPDVVYNKVFVVDDAYIAPIKARSTADASVDKHYGHPDGYGYDVESEMGSAWFHPDYDSEATCNTTFVEANIDDTYNYWINVNAATVSGVLDGHSEWSGGLYGGIELAIWTGNETDANSTIYNWYSSQADNPNRYEIFASNVYGTQESVPVHLGKVINQTISGQSEDKRVKMNYCMMGRVPNKPRQTGINFYWARRKNGEIGQKYLLFEVDFEKGYRKGGDDTWNIFYEKTQTGGSFFYVSNQFSHRSANTISSINTQMQEMPEDEPYVEKANTAIGRAGTGYKTSTIVNRRAYVGNVGYYDDKTDSTAFIKVANDTVFKSPVNQFDYFPLDNKIDVEINDGDDIIKLASVGDKLLEFKRNTLYVINCSRDIEYLEAKLKHKGVEKDYHVVEGEGFVAWMNRFGAYVYDGNQVENILFNAMGQKRLANWETAYYHDDNVLGYLPHKQTLFIGNKNGKVIMYDLKATAWQYSSNRFPTNNISNMVTTKDGNLYWYENENNVMKLHKWDDTPASLTLSDGTVILQTKDFTMDAPDVRKKIHSIYINYKIAGSGASNVEVYAVPDNGTPRQLETDSSGNASAHTLPKTSGNYNTLHMKMSWTKSALSTDYFKNVRSLSLQFVSNGSAIDSSFEINDIQVVFREKVRK